MPPDVRKVSDFPRISFLKHLGLCPELSGGAKRRHSPIFLREAKGKSKTFRTSGGTAASSISLAQAPGRSLLTANLSIDRGPQFGELNPAEMFEDDFAVPVIEKGRR
jgi:hypothetical protein